MPPTPPFRGGQQCHRVTRATSVGRIIGTLAARNLKPAVLELGGKNDRVVVDRSLAEEFNPMLAGRVSELPTGDPTKSDTVVGPQVNQATADRQYALIQDAISKGATVLAGGGAPEGRVVPPTALTGITPEMRVHTEEIFGAATTVYAVDGPEEAVALANDTKYGLTAGVIAEDLRAGLKVARQLRTGIVHVNDQPVNDEPFAPFGGIQNSGYGKFGGDAGIASFTETRWVTVQAEGHAPYPF